MRQINTNTFVLSQCRVEVVRVEEITKIIIRFRFRRAGLHVTKSKNSKNLDFANLCKPEK